MATQQNVRPIMIRLYKDYLKYRKDTGLGARSWGMYKGLSVKETELCIELGRIFNDKKEAMTLCTA